MTKVAIIQESPVFLDRKKTIEKAIKLIEQATSKNAELVVFPEAYISGYPAWVWRLRPGGDWGVSEELHSRLLDSAVDIDAGTLKFYVNNQLQYTASDDFTGWFPDAAVITSVASRYNFGQQPFKYDPPS